ncbi:MAG: hypothetical protein AMXMBFR13_36360 [Phycisphaerae bacterium]
MKIALDKLTGAGTWDFFLSAPVNTGETYGVLFTPRRDEKRSYRHQITISEQGNKMARVLLKAI